MLKTLTSYDQVHINIQTEVEKCLSTFFFTYDRKYPNKTTCETLINRDNIMKLCGWYDLDSKIQEVFGCHEFDKKIVEILAFAIAEEEVDGLRDEDFEEGVNRPEQ